VEVNVGWEKLSVLCSVFVCELIRVLLQLTLSLGLGGKAHEGGSDKGGEVHFG
jgi:hypothetical protein